MLDAGRAIALLAGRGLLDHAEIIDGELRIVDASRRNRNLHVLRRRGPSYMIKYGADGQRRRSVAGEAAVHEHLGSMRRGALTRLLPRLVAYIPKEHVLVTELVRDGESLERHHAGRGRFSRRHARRLGESLAELHLATGLRPEAGRLRRFQRGLPWGLGLHRPFVSISGAISNGGMLAIRMIQSVEGYSALLDSAAAQWTPTCLIHGDMRFDNCVVTRAGASRHDAELKLVDWELARWGDPCWDAGAVLGGYLASWLLSSPISGETPPEAVSHLGRFKFADMQRAAGAFWGAYCERMGPSSDISLRRAMQFAAVHMLESMIEELQPSAVLTGRAVCLADLAHNVLAEPDEAADHFLVTEITH